MAGLLNTMSSAFSPFFSTVSPSTEMHSTWWSSSQRFQYILSLRVAPHKKLSTRLVLWSLWMNWDIPLTSSASLVLVYLVLRSHHAMNSSLPSSMYRHSLSAV